MRLGTVIGTVTLNQRDPAFSGARWLVVSPLERGQVAAGPGGAPPVSGQPSVVVYDELGAGRGDWIAFVEGTEASAPFDRPAPVDAINVALIDSAHYQPPGHGQGAAP